MSLQVINLHRRMSKLHNLSSNMIPRIVKEGVMSPFPAFLVLGAAITSRRGLDLGDMSLFPHIPSE